VGRSIASPARTAELSGPLEAHPITGLRQRNKTIAPHHCVECWTPRQILWTDGPPDSERMVMDNATAPEVEVLVRAAFEKSWQFVSTDPVLAHGDIEDLRARLSKRLTRLAQDGERDLWRLANEAIGDLRRELTAP
jgi:hypothetical protein